MAAQVKAAEHREPLVRIAKRTDISRGKSWAIRAAAIVLALLLGALIMLLLGHNPFLVYADMVRGSLGTQIGRRETVKIAVPLLGAAVAIAPAFMMKFWNIGAEGQILAGGIAATYFALFWADTLPRVPLLIVMFLAAAIAGALWGLIPAFFKAKWGTNETLFTLMLNYIALGIEQYLQNGPWKDTKGTGFPIIAQFASNARLPKVLGVHAGWIIVLIFVVLMFLYLRYTKQGYEIAVVGESEATARYSGMSVPKIVMRTMCISGAIAGIVGFTVVSGADYTLNANTAGGVGFTAITVAWLAGLNPIIMVFIAAFLAILTKGSGTIQTNFSIPASVADVLTGIILFAMLGCEFFIRYRLIFRGKGEHSNG
ncbi:ABC transporter permease [uncultured Pseudoflavonifractor sp.]|uniref:ABC transporter permease n=1 Tax=uncultured Pseudoflavonifractor sp. TaxID=1221379 RepID=UPI0025F075FE|nr:ABC transporter permease [uncultured Pseudoflavonifractor sp.]